MIKSKQGQSQVISTLLLILMVFGAITIVMAFVFPFIKDKLSESECLDFMNQVQIKNDPEYTCYNSSARNMSIMLHLGDVENLGSLEIVVQQLGSSSSFKISNGTPPGTEGVYLFSGGDLELPGKNEERTYILTEVNDFPKSINVYPITKNGRSCPNTRDVLASIIEC